ncbi:S8 family serine peptidase [Cellulomonas sp. IC4_254]|uniref:S8 family serine peptidase n=1 Tax=Cellulomonas sp. IC4_254 TaxID=2714040 RepID=UPI00141E21BF|nr:S8 family serine peptidase [Cellulomonas sp. IC4_254]NHT18060.1 S8 family serine peptidase [Cellulomonas sp. IC4_254]
MTRTVVALGVATAVCVTATLPAAATTPAGPSPAPAVAAPVLAAPAADGADPAAPPALEATATPHVPTPAGDTVLVRFADGTTPDAQAAALAAAGAGAGVPVPGTAYLSAPVAGGDPRAAAAVLSADPVVAAAQPDLVRSATGWWSDRWADWAADYLELMRVPEAWVTGTGAGQVVAVLDGGVDPRHPDLRGRLVPGRDVLDGDDDPTDPGWHGTAVASLVVAPSGDDGAGTGVAPGARVMPVRVLDAAGRGTDADIAAGVAPGARVMPVRVLDAAGRGTDADIAAGIAWAAGHGADVLVLPLGAPGEGPVLRDAIRAAVDAGAVVVAASGNTGDDSPVYPGAYAPEVAGMVTVAGTDATGQVTPWSSWGDAVSVAALGTNVLVPAPGGNTGYRAATGTSFSAALVGGVAALLTARGSTPQQVEAVLTSTARDAGPLGQDPYTGAGVVDAGAALGRGAGTPLGRVGTPETPGDSLPLRARPLALGAAVAGTVDTVGDVDWYRVPVSAPGAYAVVATSAAGAEATQPRVTALADDGRQLATGDAPALGGAVRVVAPVAGTSAVRIGVATTSGSRGGYTLTVTRLGSATLTRVPGPALGAAPRAVVVTDLSADGRADAVTALLGRPVSDPAAVTLHPGTGDGGFTTPVPVPTGGLTGTVLGVAGARDGLVVTTTDGAVLVRAGGAPVAGTPLLAPGLGAPVVTDVEGDGTEDVVTSGAAGTLVLRGDGAGGLAAPAVVGPALPDVQAADLTGDGRAELVGLDGRVLLQQADGTFVPGATVPDPGKVGALDVVLADVTGDDRVDLVRLYLLGAVHVWPGRGDGTFGSLVLSTAVTAARRIAVADVTGDGRADVVARNQTLGEVAVLEQSPTGALERGWRVTVPEDATTDGEPLAVGDLTGDGRADVVVTGATLDVLVSAPPARGGTRAVVLDSSVTPHEAGVAPRPVLTVTLGPGVPAAAVTADTVRLLDAAGADVAVTRDYDASRGLVTVRPTADLGAGRHYRLEVRGLVDDAGAAQERPFRTWFTVGADGDRFTPVTPVRVLDTRHDWGPTAARPVRPGAPVRLDLPRDQVPAGATAVVLNVTASAPTGPGNVRVYPTPTRPGPVPTVSNLNVVAGTDQPNLVTVSLGADGSVTLATDGTTAHLIADLAGYYSPGGATGFVPRDPVRVLDTRTGTGGVRATPVPNGGWVDLQVRGRSGVPADAAAVVLNVTAVHPSMWTNVRVYPTPASTEDQEPPGVSNLNLVPGRDQSNLVTVPVGADGRVRFYSETAAVHLVADLAGYYSPTGDHGYVPLTPTRIADSRSGLGLRGGALQPGTPVRLAVAGAGGVPADAAAVVLNVTAVRPDRLSNLRVYPASAGGAVPLVSNLNVVAGRDEPNLVVTRLGTGGAVSLYSQTARTGVVVDVAGYFRR